MTPSLPTLSMASAISSPMPGVLGGDAWRPAAMSARLRSLGGLARAAPRRRRPTAASMPRLRSIGLAPGGDVAQALADQRLGQHGRGGGAVTRDVVGLGRHLLDELGAEVLVAGRSSSISRAMVTPSLVMVGAPNFLSRTTLRPRGPSVTLTVSASALTPRSERCDGRRPRSSGSSPCLTSLQRSVDGRRARALIPGSGRSRTVQLVISRFSMTARTSRAGEDQVLLAVVLHLGAAVLGVDDRRRRR